MKGNKLERVFWGIFFVAAAVILVLNQMGLLIAWGAFNFWNLLLTAILVVCGVKSAVKWNTSGLVFSLALLCILYKDVIGLGAISVWTILLAAILLSIGLSMIFHGPRKAYERKKYEKYHQQYSSYMYNGTANSNGGSDNQNSAEYAKNHEHFETVEETVDDIVNMNTTFGSSVKYVNSGNFSRANLQCSFGAMKVYFDKAVIQSGTADIWMDLSFSGVELYVPRDWKVVNDVNYSLAGFDEKNRSESTGVPVLRLAGNSNFAGVTIIYV